MSVGNAQDCKSGRQFRPFQFAESQLVVAFQKKFDIEFFRRIIQRGDSFHNFFRDFRLPVKRNENGVDRQIVVCNFIRRNVFHAAAGKRADRRRQPDQHGAGVEQHHDAADQQNKEVAAVHQQEKQKQPENSVPELLFRGSRHSRAGIRMFLRELAGQRVQFLVLSDRHKTSFFCIPLTLYHRRGKVKRDFHLFCLFGTAMEDRRLIF